MTCPLILAIFMPKRICFSIRQDYDFRKLQFQKRFAFPGPLLPYSTTTEINLMKVLDLDISILPSWSVNSPLGRFEGWLSKRGNGLLPFCPFLSDGPNRRT